MARSQIIFTLVVLLVLTAIAAALTLFFSRAITFVGPTPAALSQGGSGGSDGSGQAAGPAATSAQAPGPAVQATAPAVVPAGTALPATTPAAVSTGASPSTPAAGSVEQGAHLVEQLGCLGCHSTDGSRSVGPSFKGLYGSTVTLQDGATVTANVQYLRQSITQPGAQVVQGYPAGVMPENFGSRLDERQLQDIVAYLESL